jgi:hypothetical protein
MHLMCKKRSRGLEVVISEGVMNLILGYISELVQLPIYPVFVPLPTSHLPVLITLTLLSLLGLAHNCTFEHIVCTSFEGINLLTKRFDCALGEYHTGQDDTFRLQFSRRRIKLCFLLISL